eukprot:TRINITY_DN2389_c0_g1_i1.p2 TRINITY_DN2389_c0_g1~~TRINITY_DN2389_c0_g1_i1.p2  ORF type:complete len:88 (-),score=7.76 TRINITY_DN2389_c0_g1_i1:23-286(-)
MIMVQDKSPVGKSHRVIHLKVQEPKFPLLALPWTIKHIIDDTSPLFKQHMSDFTQFKTEIIVYLEELMKPVGTQFKQTSYLASEIVV